MAAFRNAPFEKDAQRKPLRRSVEFHWLGAWLDLDKGWKTECRPDTPSVSKHLCDYLSNHVSFEFPQYLPVRILTCSGWKIPTAHKFDLEKITVEINASAAGRAVDSDRYLLLETDMRPHTPKQDFAIRLSAIPSDEKYLDQQPRLEVTYPDDSKMTTRPK